MGDREHLYRDEANAALERVSRLAEENEELKRELARYRNGRDVPTLRTRRPGVPSWAIAACAFGVTLLVAGIASRIAFATEEPEPFVTIEMPANGRAAVTTYERSAMPRRFKDEGKCADDPGY